MRLLIIAKNSIIKIVKHIFSPTIAQARTKKMLIAACLPMILSACEQRLANVELPYDEKIVIEGLLEAGKPIDNILITRVQPPLATASTVEAVLKNAEITITVDNRTYTPQMRMDTVQLAFSFGPNPGGGPPRSTLPIYSIPNLRAEAGKTYEITVRWNGKTAQAKATVPSNERALLGEISNIAVGQDSATLSIGFTFDPVTRRSVPITGKVPRAFVSADAPVRLRPGLWHQFLIYGKDTTRFSNGRLDTTIISGGGFLSPLASSSAFGSDGTVSSLVLPPNSAERQALMNVRAGRLVDFFIDQAQQRQTLVIRGTIEQTLQRLRRAKWSVALVMTEKHYVDWFTTSNSARANGFGGGPFSSGGTNPVWNVTGDGIGVFAGSSGIEVPITVPW